MNLQNSSTSRRRSRPQISPRRKGLAELQCATAFLEVARENRFLDRNPSSGSKINAFFSVCFSLAANIIAVRW